MATQILSFRKSSKSTLEKRKYSRQSVFNKPKNESILAKRRYDVNGLRREYGDEAKKNTSKD